MITYNDIYEAARKERYSENLQKISKTFIDDFAAYTREKKEMASKEDDVFSDVLVKTKKQLENAMTLFKELLRRRREKLLRLVLIAAETGISKQDFENMLQLERELFEDIMKKIETSDRTISEILNGKIIEEIKNQLIVFDEDVEGFLDMEGNTLGPYYKGQIANIPKEIANILIEDSKASLVEE
jgi:DNA replication initiation complex subunit (GINS family)